MGKIQYMYLKCNGSSFIFISQIVTMKTNMFKEVTLCTVNH